MLRPPLAVLIVALCITLNTAGQWGSIVGGVAILALALYSALKFVAMRWPIAKVRFLIPQADYPNAAFVGAPDEEEYLKELTVAPGRYRLLYRCRSRARASMSIDGLDVAVQGQPRATNRALVSLLDANGLDWWGYSRQGVSLFPRKLTWKTPWTVFGHDVDLPDGFDGEVMLRFHVSSWGSRVTKSVSLMLPVDESAQKRSYLSYP